MKKSRFYYGNEVRFATVKLLFNGRQQPETDNVEASLVKYHGNSKRTTICGTLDTEENTLSFGVAVCSTRDRFEKKIGRSIAEKRALEKPVIVVPVTKDNISETFRKYALKLDEEMLSYTHYHDTLK